MSRAETRRPSEALDCFAVAAPGLEPLLGRELAGLGIRARVTTGGVAFHGGARELYTANLHARTASRILVRFGSFRATAFYELEKRARAVEWGRFLAPGRPVSFRVSSHASRLYHQGAIEERLQEAAIRAGAVLAPPTTEDDEGEQAQLFVVRVVRDEFVLSADASGAPLHQRGYRQALARAPLRETLAAAMLLAARWDSATPLLDPLCGSGTIPIEGALLARRIAPGLANPSHEPRSYAFQSWGDYDEGVWQRLVSEAQASILPEAAAPVLARDRDAGAMRATSENAQRAGVLESIGAERAPLSALTPPLAAAPGAVVTNPPYGKRVGDPGPLRDLYATLGNVARARLPGWSLALLSADRSLDQQLGLPLEMAFQTRNGGIPVRCLVGRVPGAAV